MSEPVLLNVDGRGIATATLNRPEVGNAYNEALLKALIAGLETLARDPHLRALVVRGAGRHFAAGADIAWLSEVAGYPPERAYECSYATTLAMARLNEFPRPSFAVIQGACFGGGFGIACCVDVALATPAAQFGITEVRVGVAPTPISTHMVNAIGLRQTRRYALTGERFGAEEALRIGLVHEVLPAEAIEARLAAILDETLLSSPAAVALTKRSFLAANGLALDERAMQMLSHEGWTIRATAEAREGLAAFRGKRRPSWAG
jgi:methylglutaconyl-CoA hydratase